MFRVTRQAGLASDPEVSDMLASVERQLRLERHGPAVRLEVANGVSDDALERLTGDLNLGRSEVYAIEGLMGMADLASLPSREPGAGGPRAGGLDPRPVAGAAGGRRVRHAG